MKRNATRAGQAITSAVSDGKPGSSNPLHWRALEPRVLFDAALARTAEAQVVQTDTGWTDDASGLAAAHAVLIEALQAADGHDDHPDTATTAAPATEVGRRSGLVFLDGSVPDPDALLAAIDPALEVILLDPGQDGIARMADALAGRTGIDAIHIISHGGEGWFRAGSTVLDAQSMQNQHLQALTAIGDALSAEGDILIYGCNFSAGKAGLEAAIVLGGITRADIAASNDNTGSDSLGGDWELEDRFGPIDSDEIQAQEWQHLLLQRHSNAGLNETLDFGDRGWSPTPATSHAQTFTNVDGSGTNIQVVPTSTARITGSAFTNAPALTAGEDAVFFTSSGFGTGSTTIRLNMTGTGVQAVGFDLFHIDRAGNGDRVTLRAVTNRGTVLTNPVIATAGAASTYSVTGNILNATGTSPLAANMQAGVNFTAPEGQTITRVEIIWQDATPRTAGAHSLGIGNIDFNNPPLAANDGPVTVVTGVASTINVLANDTDRNGGPLAIARINGTTVATGGSLTLVTGTVVTRNADGSLAVVMAPGRAEAETFSYTITDGAAAVSTATVTIARDTDRDGIADRVDLDDDNDGVLDPQEGLGVVFVNDSGGLAMYASTESFVASGPATIMGTPGGVWNAQSELFSDLRTGTVYGINPSGNLISWPSLADYAAQTNSSVLGPVPALWASGNEIWMGPDGRVFGLSDANQVVVWPGVSQFLAGTGATILGTPGGGWTNAGSTIWMGQDGQVYGFRTVSTPTSPLLRFASIENFVSQTGGVVLRNVAAPWHDTAKNEVFAVVRDSDRDAVADHIDLDSDNDGITDNVEAQSTANYIAPSGSAAAMRDVNRDGLDDRYDSSRVDVGSNAAGTYTHSGRGLVPVNTDGTDLPDIRDANSDNDGLPDITERGDGWPTFVASSVDTDGDGLLNIFEGLNVNDGYVVNDENRTQFTRNLAGVSALNASGSNAVPITIDLLFRDINNPPVAVNDSTSSPEDIGVAGNLLGNDRDADGHPLSVTQFVWGGASYLANQAAHINGIGILAIAANGSYSFVPALNYNGVVPATTYTVSDGSGGSATAVLSLTITPQNDPPVVDLNGISPPVELIVNGGFEANTGSNPVAWSANGGTPFSPIAYAGDPVVPPHTGAVALDLGPSGAVGQNGGWAEQTVSIPAAGRYDLSFFYATEEGGFTESSVFRLTLSGVINASYDFPSADDYQSFVQSLNAPTAGSLTIRFTDLATTGYNTIIDDVSLMRHDTDRNHLASFIENGAPVAITSPGLVVADVDNTVLASGTVVLTNAQAGDVLAIGLLPSAISASIDSSVAGRITINLAGAASLLEYQAALQVITFANTSDAPSVTDRNISVTLNDGSANSNSAITTIRVTALNDAPVDGDESNAATEDATLIVDATAGLLANTTDVDSAAATVSAFAVAGQTGPFDVGVPYAISGVGSLTINADGSYRFAPVADYDGSIPVVTYTVDDGNGGSDTSTLNLTLLAVNDPPGAVAPMSILLVEDGYSPLTGFAFDDVDSGAAATRLTLAVPVGTGVLDWTNRSLVSATGSGTNLLTLLGPRTEINDAIAAGHIGFRPAANTHGTTSLTLVFNDAGNTGTDPGLTGDAGSEAVTANIALTVTAVNDAPTGADTRTSLGEDAAYTFRAADFGFSDQNDNPAHSLQSVIITSMPSAGTLTLSGVTVTAGRIIPLADIPNLVWAPPANLNGLGLASFSFQVVDNGGTDNGGQNTDASPNTVSFDVMPINDAPLANDVRGEGIGGEVIGLGFTGVDVDGAVVSIRITNLPLAEQGVLRLPDGTSLAASTDLTPAQAAALTFVPRPGFVGWVTMSFTVTDNLGAVSAPASVIIRVGAADLKASDASGNELFDSDDRSGTASPRASAILAAGDGDGFHETPDQTRSIEVGGAVIDAVNGLAYLHGTDIGESTGEPVVAGAVASLSRHTFADVAIGRVRSSIVPLAAPSDLERLGHASIRVPTAIGLDNDRQVRDAAGEKFDLRNTSHARVDATARAMGLGRDIEVSLDRRGQQDIIAIADVAPQGLGAIVKMRIQMADGHQPPTWVRLLDDGVIIVDRPTDVQRIDLLLTIEREGGKIRSHLIQIDPNAVTVSDPQSKALTLGAMSFGEQLQAAGVADHEHTGHRQLLQALNG